MYLNTLYFSTTVCINVSMLQPNIHTVHAVCQHNPSGYSSWCDMFLHLSLTDSNNAPIQICLRLDVSIYEHNTEFLWGSQKSVTQTKLPLHRHVTFIMLLIRAHPFWTPSWTSPMIYLFIPYLFKTHFTELHFLQPTYTLHIAPSILSFTTLIIFGSTQ
jgi:hypothetical protein